MSQAKAIKDESPEISEKVERGELRIPDAVREVKKQRQEKQAAESDWPDWPVPQYCRWIAILLRADQSECCEAFRQC